MDKRVEIFYDLRRRVMLHPENPKKAYREWRDAQLSDGASVEDVHFVMALDQTIIEMAQPADEPPRLVLLLHGIRTQAEWQGMVSAALARPGTTVESIKYEFYDAVRFWCPIGTRRKVLDQINWKLRHAIAENPGSEVIVIAHSFGTYAIIRALKENPDIRCKRLVLCGSIVDSKFRWDQLAHCPKTVNDCGTLDIWPIMAKSLSWGYGASGAFGFGTPTIKERFHRLRHSDYFTRDFVAKYWEPWIHGDTFVPSEHDSHREITPWSRSILGFLPLNWILLASLIAGTYFAIAWLLR